ncbi:MAG TPA: ABC-F family ATP-binding cassette domain-containing protein [Bacillales bacterium]|nr:ABC-F family ATP-binding cassette domain-containing protein [Bacillales bacterium]
MSIVNVENLTHGFGDKTVFKDVSFRLLKGEHIGLVGPNGAGKTTMLRIMTGQQIPDEGWIEWLPGTRKGFLEQHVDLREGETIREYLRGAFGELFEAEREMIEVSEQMGSSGGEELEALLKRYGRLQESLEQNDFYSVDAKVDEVADGLGLTALGLDTDVSSMSGGQRTKLLLGKLLLERPEVLLLDEPTNYLDTAHIEWLTAYLKEYPNAFILISHDTDFMNQVVGIIYHLEHQQLIRYVGNYTQFQAAYEMRKRQIYEAYERQQQEIQQMETFIKKNKARASTSKRAKSREKRLQKIERIEKPTKVPRPKFWFRVAAEPVRVVVEASELAVGYREPLYNAVDLKLERGEKVALVGRNGIGKTTTLKTLLGELPALDGKVHLGDRVRPAYFEQEAASQAEHSAFDEVWTAFPELTKKEARQMLARCGLKSEHIFQPMKALSGGEQTKVRLCKLMLADSNWLVIDEPTNHLDVEAQEVLQEALRDYSGTVLLVSHDPAFYENWITRVWDVEDWR